MLFPYLFILLAEYIYVLDEDNCGCLKLQEKLQYTDITVLIAKNAKDLQYWMSMNMVK